MPCTRHLIVCEGESEWTYLQRLQSFLNQQEVEGGGFEPPLIFVAPARAIAKTGSFGKIVTTFKKTRRENRTRSVRIWTDFDLYHRDDNNCAAHYAQKPQGIPNFLFSCHNFEDFYALHWDGTALQDWLNFGNRGHFATPLHADGYLPEIKRIFPGYGKGSLSPDFLTWDRLRNLKQNLIHQPQTNPQNLQGLGCFADFLIQEIDKAYPGKL